MKTILARILLVITDDGAWYAEGSDRVKPKDLIESTNELLRSSGWSPPFEFYWIEADVPVPAPLKPRHLSPLFIKTKKGPSRPKGRP